jgi:hypothetical protein
MNLGFRLGQWNLLELYLIPRFVRSIKRILAVRMELQRDYEEMDISSQTNRIPPRPNDGNDQNQEPNTRNDRLRNVHDSLRSLNTQRADSHTNEGPKTTLRTNKQSSHINEQGTPQQEQSHENDPTRIIQDSTNEVSVPTKGSAPWPIPDLSSPIPRSEHEDEDDDIDELSIMYQPRHD